MFFNLYILGCDSFHGANFHSNAKANLRPSLWPQRGRVAGIKAQWVYFLKNFLERSRLDIAEKRISILENNQIDAGKKRLHTHIDVHTHTKRERKRKKNIRDTVKITTVKSESQRQGREEMGKTAYLKK